MANIKELRKGLVDVRNSLRGLKAGLANKKNDTDEGKVWREWAQDNADWYREELNKLIAMVDEITGK